MDSFSQRTKDETEHLQIMVAFGLMRVTTSGPFQSFYHLIQKKKKEKEKKMVASGPRLDTRIHVYSIT